MKKIVFFSLLFVVSLVFVGCSFDAGYVSGDLPFETQAHDTELSESVDTMSEEEVFPPVTPPKEERVSFLAVGDNIIYAGQLREGKKNASSDPDYEGEYDFRPMYKNVADLISSADIAFVNQETVMSKRYEPSQYPDFNSPQELGENLVEVGFDVVNIATNHMLDMWYDGLVDTVKFWKTQDVLMVGGYKDKDDFMNVRYIERKGVKIAVVGFTYSPKNREDQPMFIPKINDELIVEWISKAKNESDFIVVSMHWGEEYNQTPNKEQRRLAQLIADSGADVIIGHHTHCLQPIEWIEAADGGRTLCFFSLGNFTSETDETVSLPGGIASFDIVKNELTGIRIENVTLTPTVMDYRSSFNKNTVYLLEDYTDELCKTHNIVSYFKKQLNMDMLRQYVANAIDTEYLSKGYLESLI